MIRRWGDIFLSIINSAPAPVIWMSESANEVVAPEGATRVDSVKVEVEEEVGKGEEGESIMTPL